MVDYTTRGGAIKQEKGENRNTWGSVENTNYKDVVDAALHGVEQITVSGSVTLTNVNGDATSQARQPVHVLSGTGGTITVPNVENKWLVVNGATGSVTYTSGGTSIALEADEKAWVYTDGTDVYKALTSSIDLSSAFQTTSSTANALAIGSLVYTVDAGKALAVGMNVRIADDVAPATNYADGVITAYSGTSITILVSSVTGSGTPATVTIAFSQAQVTLPSPIGENGKVLGVQSNEYALVDGGSFDYEEFTSNGTWTKPSGVTFVRVEAWGGGGGGQNRTGGVDAGGGGGGAYAALVFQASDLGSTVAVTIGSGGAGGADAGNNDGADGGDTTFGTHLTAPGGKGGFSNGGDGGGGEPGSTGATAAGGGFSSGGGGDNTQDGGASVMGGGGGGGADNGSNSGSGGVSANGGNGGDGVHASSTPGGDGAIPGGGGGASCNDGGGGSGADGRLRVWAW